MEEQPMHGDHVLSCDAEIRRPVKKASRLGAALQHTGRCGFCAACLPLAGMGAACLPSLMSIHAAPVPDVLLAPSDSDLKWVVGSSPHRLLLSMSPHSGVHSKLWGGCIQGQAEHGPVGVHPWAIHPHLPHMRVPAVLVV